MKIYDDKALYLQIKDGSTTENILIIEDTEFTLGERATGKIVIGKTLNKDHE